MKEKNILKQIVLAIVLAAYLEMKGLKQPSARQPQESGQLYGQNADTLKSKPGQVAKNNGICMDNGVYCGIYLRSQLTVKYRIFKMNAKPPAPRQLPKFRLQRARLHC